ncbi:hypothetical protein [Desulfomicrobium salsuginis]
MAGRWLCAVVLIVCSAVGCANQVPVAENFSLSTQKKLRAPHHWDVIANDVVAETKRSLDYNDDLKGRPVFIESSQNGYSAFNAAFRNFVITGLVNSGILVTENPNDAVLIKYDTQVVRHGVDRKYSPLQSMVLVSRNLQENGRSEDYGSTWTYLTDGPTDSELIVNTSIVENGNYRMRKSDVYYVDGEDIRLFLPKAQQIPVRDLKVVGQ